MKHIFHRRQLAEELALKLLRPGILDDGIRSGLFLSGIRRIGKTTFLRSDLIPKLEEKGAIVVYVDLWQDPQSSPSRLVSQAIRNVVEGLQSPASRILAYLKRLKGLAPGPNGLELGFDLEKIGDPAGHSLAEVITELVDSAKTDVVLIIDEVQHALNTEDGLALMHALKAARDAVNTRPVTPGYMLFLGTGSHRAMVGEMAVRRNQAFAGATSRDFPPLGREYVEYLLGELRERFARLPSAETTYQAFEELGNRPEELKRALGVLMEAVANGQDPDEHLRTVTAAFREKAAEVEIAKIEELGQLACVIYDAIAKPDAPAKGLYSMPALKAYEAALERQVAADEVQTVIRKLQSANLVMSVGHGTYTPTDPFVRRVWRIAHDEE